MSTEDMTDDRKCMAGRVSADGEEMAAEGMACDRESCGERGDCYSGHGFWRGHMESKPPYGECGEEY